MSGERVSDSPGFTVTRLAYCERYDDSILVRPELEHERNMFNVEFEFVLPELEKLVQLLKNKQVRSWKEL